MKNSENSIFSVKKSDSPMPVSPPSVFNKIATIEQQATQGLQLLR